MLRLIAYFLLLFLSVGCFQPCSADDAPIAAATSSEVSVPLNPASHDKDVSTSEFNMMVQPSSDASVKRNRFTAAPLYGQVEQKQQSPSAARKSGGLFGFLNPLGGTQRALQGLEDPIGGLANPIRQLRSPLQKLQQPIRELRRPLEELNEPLERLDSSIQNLRTPVDELQRPLTNLEQPIRDLNQPLRSLQQPINSLSTPLKKLDKRVNQLNAGVNGLKSPMNSVSTQVSALRAPLSDLVRPVENIGTPLNRIATPLNRLSTPIEHLSPAVGQLSTSVTGLREQVANLQDQVKTLRTSMNDIARNISLAVAFGAITISVAIFAHRKIPAATQPTRTVMETVEDSPPRSTGSVSESSSAEVPWSTSRRPSPHKSSRKTVITTAPIAPEESLEALQPDTKSGD